MDFSFAFALDPVETDWLHELSHLGDGIFCLALPVACRRPGTLRPYSASEPSSSHPGPGKASPDLSHFPAVRGNLKLALVMIALLWVLAAFGEELVYRGYLMNRVADLGRGTRTVWIVSLFLISALFGFAHYEQGLTGIS